MVSCGVAVTEKEKEPGEIRHDMVHDLIRLQKTICFSEGACLNGTYQKARNERTFQIYIPRTMRATYIKKREKNILITYWAPLFIFFDSQRLH